MAIRVLRITSNLTKGGAGAHVLAIHRALSRFPDVESDLWCPRETIAGARMVDCRLSPLTLAFNFLRTRMLGLDSLYAPQWRRLFAQLLPSYDIIHLHHLQGYFFDLRSLALLRQKPVVLTLHDMWPLTGRCSFSQDCEKWRTHCRRCPHLKMYPATYVDLSRFLHAFKKKAFLSLQKLQAAAISEHAAAQARAGFLREVPIHVIPPGICCDDFPPKVKSNRSETVIGAVAVKLDFGSKGFDDLLALVRHLQCDGRYRMRLIGDVSSDHLRQIRKLERVEWYPFTQNAAELCRHYQTMDVLINLSRQEMFGKTVIEAQSVGTPVLARDIPPFRENVLFGALQQDCRPPAIFAQLEQLLARSWDAELMHQTIRKKYDVALLGERYAALYRSFFHKGRP